MAYRILNRAKMSVSGTPGTGNITLGSASTGFMDLATAGISNGDTFPYVIEDSSNWEIGIATYSSTGPTVTRTTVVASSAGGTTPISATSAAVIFLAPLAWDLSNTGYGTGGGVYPSQDQAFHLNSQNIASSYSIPSGFNAGSFGPVTVNSGATVTVPSGSVWTIV